MKLLVLAVLTVVVCGGAGVTPPPAQPAEPAVTPAPPPGPITVVVSFFLSDILRYDPTTGFVVDGYLSFYCSQPCGDLKILVYNGRATSREVVVNEPNDQITRM